MIYSLFYLVVLILVPLLAYLREWKPAALFFAASVVYIAFGAASFAQIQINLSQIKQTEPAFHDTYYVVSHGHVSLNMGIGMAFYGVITWVQRFRRKLHNTDGTIGRVKLRNTSPIRENSP